MTIIALRFSCVLLGVALVSAGCSLEPSCGDRLVASVASGDGRYVAEVVELNCGATTDYATHVRLRASGDASARSEDPPVLVLAGAHEIHPEWIGERSLRLAVPVAEVFRRTLRWRDVTVSFE